MSFVTDIDAAALPGAHADALGEMFRGERAALIVRGLFARDEIDALVQRLRGGDTGAPEHPATHFAGKSFGHVLVVSGKDASEYFDDATRFRDAMRGLGDPTERIATTFQKLSNGLPVCLPEGPSGAVYGPMTVRVIEPGGEIDAHCENETLGFPAMLDLAERVETVTQLSYYVPLVIPEGGGELVLYGVHFDSPNGKRMKSLPRDRETVERELEPHRLGVLAPGVGDLLLFDSGRHFHRVTPVQGTRQRWTMGGFVARSRDHSRIHYWA